MGLLVQEYGVGPLWAAPIGRWAAARRDIRLPIIKIMSGAGFPHAGASRRANGCSTERMCCRTVVLANGCSIGRMFYRTDVLPNGCATERLCYRTDVLAVGQRATTRGRVVGRRGCPPGPLVATAWWPSAHEPDGHHQHRGSHRDVHAVTSSTVGGQGAWR